MIRNRKRLIVLIIMLVLSILIFSYASKKGTSVNEVFLYPFDLINFSTSKIFTVIKKLTNTMNENEELKRQLNELKVERQLYNEIILENQRLKNILALKDYSLNYFTTAKPIARGYDRLLNTIVIDKGKNNGIRKDMPVITVNGLIGKIHAVRDDFSEVLLLKDPNFSAAIRLQDSRHEGVVVGTGRNYCIIKYIPPEESIKKDEPVITSGLDGIFPPGIPVGIISFVGSERTDFFHYIELTPYQPDSKIEDVIILLPYNEKKSRGISKN